MNVHYSIRIPLAVLRKHEPHIPWTEDIVRYCSFQWTMTASPAGVPLADGPQEMCQVDLAGGNRSFPLHEVVEGSRR